MKTLSLVGAVALLLAGTAMGASTVSFDLRIGGDNHVADWENPSSVINTAFTQGTDTPAKQTGIVTWDVSAAASGTDAGTLDVQGVANVVFDLTLKDSGGNVVSTAKFFSTMNDGDNQGARRSNTGSYDPFEKSAWCLGWDVDMDYGGALDGLAPPVSTGRLFDQVTAGGPYMDRVQFGSTAAHGGGRMSGGEGGYFPDCNGNLVNDYTELNGTTDADANNILDACEAGTATVTNIAAGNLAGIGIGYSQFVGGGNPANNLGVGIAAGSLTPSWSIFALVGLGIKPAAEGQIDMTGLPSGMYTLELTAPAAGQNVVVGSFDPNGAATGGFAAKADAVVTDSVTFEWEGVVTVPVTVATIKSVRNHGGAGALGVALDPTDAVINMEPRSGGLQSLVVVFSGSLTQANYPKGAVAITGTAGLAAGAATLSTTTVANDTLTIPLTGCVDTGCYLIDLAAICDFVPGADTTCKVGALAGDMNADRVVNLIDVANTKAKNASSVAADPKFDQNVDGTINLIDVANTKASNGKSLSACP